MFLIMPPNGWASPAWSGLGLLKLAERSLKTGMRGADGSLGRVGQGSRPSGKDGGTNSPDQGYQHYGQKQGAAGEVKMREHVLLPRYSQQCQPNERYAENIADEGMTPPGYPGNVESAQLRLFLETHEHKLPLIGSRMQFFRAHLFSYVIFSSLLQV